MNLGFEVTAATPKRLRDVQDAPVAQTMRGERKITQAPSADQKKARRQQQRKTASVTDSPEMFAKAVMDEYDRLEAEAGIRDWWRAKNTPLDPLKDSGLPGSPSSAPQEAPPRLTSACRSCNGSGTGFHNEVCSRCGGTGSGKANRINPNFGISEDSHAPFRPMDDFSRGASLRLQAANFSAGDCRMCEGNLIPMGTKSDSPSTMKAQCADCGTKHELQGAQVKRVGQALLEFQNLPLREIMALRVLANILDAEKAPCPNCQSSEWGMRKSYGHANGSEEGLRWMMHCRDCDHRYMQTDTTSGRGARQREDDMGRGASNETLRLLPFLGCSWVVDADVSPYMAQSGMSAIARRAQSVLDNKEIL